MRRWLARLGLGLVGLLVLLVLLGATYEQYMRHRAARRYPPMGKLVDLGAGRHLQIDCRGAGTPTVVFEAGGDNLGSLAWAAVHDSIATTTRACAYSRAGMLWSDPGSGPFDPRAAERDLRTALTAAGERPPFIMVGHSLGGPYIMIFTSLYPADVAGLVFVDASHPDQVDRMRAFDSGGDRHREYAAGRRTLPRSWESAARGADGNQAASRRGAQIRGPQTGPGPALPGDLASAPR